jgi:hypothetical protein
MWCGLLQSVTLGIGVFVLMLAALKGNALVFVGPMALWTAITSYPATPQKGPKNRHRLAELPMVDGLRLCGHNTIGLAFCPMCVAMDVCMQW